MEEINKSVMECEAERRGFGIELARPLYIIRKALFNWIYALAQKKSQQYAEHTVFKVVLLAKC